MSTRAAKLLHVKSHAQRHRSGEAATDEIDRQSDPVALRLVTPEIDGPPYDTIGPEHDLYPLGLLAYRLGVRGRLGEAQAVADGLRRPWPRVAGEHSNAEHRALTAATLADNGLDNGDVADAFGVQPDTARRLVKAGRALQRPERDFAPYVEAVGTATQPAALTRLQSWTRPDETRMNLHQLRVGKIDRLPR